MRVKSLWVVGLVAAMGILAGSERARAEDPAKSTPAWRDELLKVLDPENLDAPADRLGAAKKILEEKLAQKEEATLRLELAMILLCDDPEKAHAEATKAKAAPEKGLSDAAHAVAYLAKLEWEQKKIERSGEKPTQEQLVKKIKEAMDAEQKLLLAAFDDPSAARAAVDTATSAVKGLKRIRELGKRVAKIDGSDLAGKPIDVAEFKGKVLLIDFWATWCFPCQREMPGVVAMYKDLAPKGFEVVGVSLDKDKTKLVEYLGKEGVTWRQYFDGKGWDNSVAKAWGITSIPATYLIDHEGVVRYVGLNGPALRKAVEKLLDRAAKAKGETKGS